MHLHLTISYLPGQEIKWPSLDAYDAGSITTIHLVYNRNMRTDYDIANRLVRYGNHRALIFATLQIESVATALDYEPDTPTPASWNIIFEKRVRTAWNERHLTIVHEYEDEADLIGWRRC